MIARLDHLRTHPAVFRHLTGLTVAAFDALAADVVPAVEAAHRKALDRPDRERAIGAGGEFGLATADQVLLAVIWLRQYPTQEALGFLFGVSDSTALRAARRCLPALEQAGEDTMRMPGPGPAEEAARPAGRYPRAGGGDRHVRAADAPAEAAAAGVLLGEEEGPHPEVPGRGGRADRAGGGRVRLRPRADGGHQAPEEVPAPEAAPRGGGRD